MSDATKTVTVFAMTQKGYEVVRIIANKYPEIIRKVVIGRDSALASDYSDHIRTVCETHNISYSYKEDKIDVTSDFAMTVSWRWMIDIPSNRLIVLHDSPLPKYRGFAPLVNALINGESEIGVSAIWGASEYDRGDIIFQKTTQIQYPITIQEAIEINNANYISVVVKIFELLRSCKTLPSISQCEENATYSIWRDVNDYKIDWTLSAEEIRRFIDAVGYPYAGAFTHYSGKKIIIESAEEVSDVKCEIRSVGKVIFVQMGCPVIICGSGLLKITSAKEQQADGKLELFLPIKKFRTRFE